MATGYDMRRLTRVILDWPATLSSKDNTVLPVVLRNLSVNGAYVLSEETFPVGTEISLLADYLDSPIEARGIVNRIEPDGMGLKFDGIDKDGFDSLVDLLVENATDADVIRLEILEDWKLNIEIYD